MCKEQSSGTTINDLEILSGSAGIIANTFGSNNYEIRTGMENSISLSPIEYEGESVFFNPQHMIIEQTYPFLFMGYRFVAIKKHDESIELYYLEN